MDGDLTRNTRGCRSDSSDDVGSHDGNIGLGEREGGGGRKGWKGDIREDEGRGP